MNGFSFGNLELLFRDLKRLFKEAEFAVPVPNFGPLREWNSCFRNWNACFLRLDRAQIQELKLRRAVGAAAGLAPWSSEREIQLSAPCRHAAPKPRFPGAHGPRPYRLGNQQKIFDRESTPKSLESFGRKNPRRREAEFVDSRELRLGAFWALPVQVSWFLGRRISRVLASLRPTKIFGFPWAVKEKWLWLCTAGLRN